MFNPVSPYGYLLPNVYLCMADIENPDLFVCVCRTWICLDITRFYKEQRQPSSGSVWPTFPKTVNRAPVAGGGRFRHNLHSSLYPLWQLHCLYAVSYGACNFCLSFLLADFNILFF